MLNKGTVLSDRYEVIERVGSGGMADVYRAIDHKLNRYVAIKILKRDYADDKQFIAKFRSEARAAAAISNPNIVNVYDVGDDNGIYFIVMELIEGITLKQYIDRKGHLDYKEAVSISIQIANGMEAAHSHHIIHRDIKPQNIIISRDGKVKVTDFGIARVATATTTVATNAIGSVHYMSPEQARGGYLDERSDIYSFGITLFEMLTGQVPFDGDTTVAVAVHHIQDEIEPPSEYISGVPISVDKIVQKCTRKKSDYRYQNMAELISDLKKSLIMPDVDFVMNPEAFDEAVDEDTSKDTEVTSATDVVDIDDENNEKIDGVMKWVGIGIAAAIIVTIIIVIIVLSTNGIIGNKKETTSQTSSETVENSDTVEVPKVVGMDVDEAKTVLTDKGFSVRVKYNKDSNEDQGTVLEQSLAEGVKVSKGSQVMITVAGEDPSKTTQTTEKATEKTTETTEAKKTVTVPSVIGYSQSDAASTITSLGLGYSEVSAQYSDTVPRGSVITQSPAAGSQVSAGITVTTVISNGPAPTTQAPTTQAPTTQAPTTAAPDNQSDSE